MRGLPRVAQLDHPAPCLTLDRPHALRLAPALAIPKLADGVQRVEGDGGGAGGGADHTGAIDDGRGRHAQPWVEAKARLPVLREQRLVQLRRVWEARGQPRRLEAAQGPKIVGRVDHAALLDVAAVLRHHRPEEVERARHASGQHGDDGARLKLRHVAPALDVGRHHLVVGPDAPVQRVIEDARDVGVGDGGGRRAPLVDVELRRLATPAHHEYRQRRRVARAQRPAQVGSIGVHDHVAVLRRIETLATGVAPIRVEVSDAHWRLRRRRLAFQHLRWPVLLDVCAQPPIRATDARAEHAGGRRGHREVVAAVLLAHAIEDLHRLALAVHHALARRHRARRSSPIPRACARRVTTSG